MASVDYLPRVGGPTLSVGRGWWGWGRGVGSSGAQWPPVAPCEAEKCPRGWARLGRLGSGAQEPGEVRSVF